MFGKIHGDMFTGSMMGSGALSFAVMGYVIANQQPNRDRSEFRVELRPRLMAVLIGEPEGDIQKKIDEFCGPDNESRSLERGDKTGGAKLIKEGPFTYLVVNGAYYDGLRRQADKQEKDRQRQARHREKSAVSVIDAAPAEPPEKLRTQPFMLAWGKWMNYRRGFKKVKDWRGLFESQLEYLSRFNSDQAVEVLNQSMRNGWQGLFDSKDSNGKNTTKPNPRNAGVCRVENYGDVAHLFTGKKVVGQVAQAGHESTPGSDQAGV